MQGKYSNRLRNRHKNVKFPILHLLKDKESKETPIKVRISWQLFVMLAFTTLERFISVDLLSKRLGTTEMASMNEGLNSLAVSWSLIS